LNVGTKDIERELNYLNSQQSLSDSIKSALEDVGQSVDIEWYGDTKTRKKRIASLAQDEADIYFKEYERINKRAEKNPELNKFAMSAYEQYSEKQANANAASAEAILAERDWQNAPYTIAIDSISKRITSL